MDHSKLTDFIDTMKSKTKYWLLIILLLAAGLRLSVINWGLPDQEHFYPFYPDEYTVMMVLQNMNPAKLNFYPQYVPYNRLYPDPVSHYYLIGFSEFVAAKLSLLKLTKDKTYYLHNPAMYARLYLTGRYISILMGLGTILLVFLIGARIYSPQAGLAAALFLALSPLHLVYSALMNVAVPTAFWISLALYWLVRFLETREMKWSILAGFTTGLAIGTKFTAFPLLLVLLTAHIISEKKLAFNKKIIISFLMVLAAFALSNPYYIIAYQESVCEFISRYNIVFSQSVSHPASGLTIFGFWYPLRSLLYNALGPALLLLAIGGFFLAVVKRSKYDLLLLSWIIAYYLISAQAGTDIIRYQTEQLPFMVLLAGRLLFYDYGFWKKGNWLRLKLLLTILVIAIAGIVTIARSAVIIDLMREPDPRSTASQWIKANIPNLAKIGLFSAPSEYAAPVINMQYYHDSRYPALALGCPAYKLIDLNYSLEKLKQEDPDSIIFTENEQGIAKRSIVDQSNFLDAVLQKYQIVKIFSIEPQLAGCKIKDLSYPRFIIRHQPIYILQKITGGTE